MSVLVARWRIRLGLGRLGADLRVRLLWLAMLPVLMFAIAWGIYVIRQRAEDLEARLQQRAELLARQLAVAADYGLFSMNVDALSSLAQGVAREDSVIAATVLDSNLEVLAIHPSAQGRLQTLSPALRSMLEWSVQHGHSAVTEHADERIAHLEPVRSPAVQVEDMPQERLYMPGAGVRGYVIVEVGTRAIQRELLAFGFKVIALLVGVLTSAWIMVRRFSSRIDRRIQILIQAAHAIGAGQGGVRVRASGIPSFDRLAHGINLMAKQLEHSRSQLEQRVEQATLALREQRDAAQEANQAKTRFLAAASHDLRQPMHALSLLVAALKQERRPTEQENLLERIDSTSQAMSALLNALLDISRLDAGGVKVQLSSFDLYPVLLRLRDMYEEAAQRQGIDLLILPAHGHVYSDAMLLERMLGNFLSNALRYTPAGGRVVLLVRRKSTGQYQIQVRDNGPGIPQKSQSIIFQEFVQLHNPQRDRSQGLGLGLAIVQRLALLLWHEVGVRSAPGCGSTFYVNVARAEPPQAVPASPHSHVVATTDAGSGTQSELSGCRILLVEDDAMVRDSYSRLLELWGCEVQLHSSGDSALAEFGRTGSCPDLIISDHRLGGQIDGRQLIAALQESCTNKPGAVLVTGDTEAPALRELASPRVRLMFKPVRPVELRAALLELWLESRQTTNQ